MTVFSFFFFRESSSWVSTNLIILVAQSPVVIIHSAPWFPPTLGRLGADLVQVAVDVSGEGGGGGGGVETLGTHDD